jgi:hypothetical protein
MMQRTTVLQRNADHGFFCSSSSLVDRLRHFARLAMAKTYTALAITNNDERRKAEALTALNGFGDAVDVNELFDRAIIFLFLARFAIIAATTATTFTTATTTPATAAFGLTTFNGSCVYDDFACVIFVSHH